MLLTPLMLTSSPLCMKAFNNVFAFSSRLSEVFLRLNILGLSVSGMIFYSSLYDVNDVKHSKAGVCCFC